MNLELDKSSPKEVEAVPGVVVNSKSGEGKALPDDALILIPVRNTVMFPGMILPIAISRQMSINAAQPALKAERPVGLLLQKNAETAAPAPEDMHEVGTVMNMLRYITAQDGSHHVVCQGQERFRVIEFLSGHEFLAARVERIAEPEAKGTEIPIKAV